MGAPSRNKPVNNWYASLPKLPLPPTAVFASAHALAEMDFLREPLSAAAHTACEHVRTLESFGSSTAREQVLSVVKMTPRNPASEKSVLRRMSTAPPEKVNNSRCCEETDL